MPRFLFKWLLIPFSLILLTSATWHPIFMSVTEIEHNQKTKSLEISCKIFTDDFEKTLRTAYKTHVDLLDSKQKQSMDRLVNDYVQKHLKIAVNGKAASMKYVGFENIDEGIYCYFEVTDVSKVTKINVTDNVLFEYKDEQINIIHAIVNGTRKSTKLNNPQDKAEFNF